jgi:hypothetical protein
VDDSEEHRLDVLDVPAAEQRAEVPKRLGLRPAPRLDPLRSLRLDAEVRGDVPWPGRLTALVLDLMISGLVLAGCRPDRNGVVRAMCASASAISSGRSTRPVATVQRRSTVVASRCAVGPEVMVADLTYAANGWVRVRARVTGSSPATLRVRAWAEGQPEPEIWHFTGTDSQAGLQKPGAVGLRAYLGSSSTNAPILVRFDDIVVTDLQ